MESVLACEAVWKKETFIMLQDVPRKMIENNKGVDLVAEDALITNEKLLLVSKDVNAVFTVDLYDGKVNLVGSFPESDFLSPRLSAKIIEYGDEWIFAPMNAEKIWFLNKNTLAWRSVPIRLKSIPLKIFQGIRYQDKAFLIGANYPAIICMDMITNKLTYFEEAYKHLEDKRKQLADGYVRNDYVQDGDCFYVASTLSNEVLKFCMSDCSYEWIKIGNEENRYVGIAWDGKSFWLAPRNGRAVVRWDGEKCVEYKLPQIPGISGSIFLGCIYDEGKIIMPGNEWGGKTVTFRIDNPFEMTVLPDRYSLYRKVSSEVIVYQTIEGNITIKTKSSIHTYPCKVPQETWDEFKRTNRANIQQSLQKKLYTENKTVNLADVLTAVIDEDKVNTGV